MTQQNRYYHIFVNDFVQSSHVCEYLSEQISKQTKQQNSSFTLSVCIYVPSSQRHSLSFYLMLLFILLWPVHLKKWSPPTITTIIKWCMHLPWVNTDTIVRIRAGLIEAQAIYRFPYDNEVVFFWRVARMLCQCQSKNCFQIKTNKINTNTCTVSPKCHTKVTTNTYLSFIHLHTHTHAHNLD